MERGYIATVLKVMISFLEKRALLASVKERVKPPTRQLIEKPPLLPFSVIEHEPIDDIFDAVAKLPRGDELLAEIGQAVAHHLSGSVLAPVVQMALSLFGATPPSIFGNLERFYSIPVRGMSFAWESTGERTGVVTARAVAPVSIWHVTRGNLREAFALCGVDGDVAAPEPIADGARYRVRW